MRCMILIFLPLFFACQSNTQKDDSSNLLEEPSKETSATVQDSIEFNAEFIADSFDFPIGKPKGKRYESLYAHCDSVLVKQGDWVKRGNQIGNVNGLYYAPLHLEIREKENRPIGGGYSTDQNVYLDPTSFIKKNRIVKINKTNNQ